MPSPYPSLALLGVWTALLAGCATRQPEPIPEGVQIAEPSQQKCATVTGSRIATTCSYLVKSTTNKGAMREMQSHRSLGKDGDTGWGSPTGR